MSLYFVALLSVIMLNAIVSNVVAPNYHFLYLAFSDIDECDKSLGPNGKCGANAICSNTDGGFTCACQVSMSQNPFSSSLKV
jgi:hypothetical protein